MEAKHKRFIRNKLIPFILRDAGRGFVMETWLDKGIVPREPIYLDDIERPGPKCGTAGCIGGSIQCQLGLKRKPSTRALAAVLGITPRQADGLFYQWSYDTDPDYLEYCPKYGWPIKFVKAFAARVTALGKAKVAVRLLEEVIRTNGECLNLRSE